MSVVRPFRLPVARASLALVLLAPRLGAQAAVQPPAVQEPTAAGAAAPAPVTPADSAAPVPRGPTQDAARVGAQRSAESGPLEANAPRRGGPGFGRSEAMMIVGGTAVVIGLIIGDGAGGALAFGGAVVGLVGLYQYLR
jgi:uncharacterized membrane protein